MTRKELRENRFQTPEGEVMHINYCCLYGMQIQIDHDIAVEMNRTDEFYDLVCSEIWTIWISKYLGKEHMPYILGPDGREKDNPSFDRNAVNILLKKGKDVVLDIREKCLDGFFNEEREKYWYCKEHDEDYDFPVENYDFF